MGMLGFNAALPALCCEVKSRGLGWVGRVGWGKEEVKSKLLPTVMWKSAVCCTQGEFIWRQLTLGTRTTLWALPGLLGPPSLPGVLKCPVVHLALWTTQTSPLISLLSQKMWARALCLPARKIWAALVAQIQNPHSFSRAWGPTQLQGPDLCTQLSLCRPNFLCGFCFFSRGDCLPPASSKLGYVKFNRSPKEEYVGCHIRDPNELWSLVYAPPLYSQCLKSVVRERWPRTAWGRGKAWRCPSLHWGSQPASTWEGELLGH